MVRAQCSQRHKRRREFHRRRWIELLVLVLRGNDLAVESFNEHALHAVQRPH